MEDHERRAAPDGVVGIPAVVIRERMHVAGEYQQILDPVISEEICELGAFGRKPRPRINAQLGRSDPRRCVDPNNQRERGGARRNQLLLEPRFLGGSEARLVRRLGRTCQGRRAMQIRHDHPHSADRESLRDRAARDGDRVVRHRLAIHAAHRGGTDGGTVAIVSREIMIVPHVGQRNTAVERT